MVRVSRSAEAIPLLVPNDALRRDEARAGAGPVRGRCGAGERSGSRNFVVATLLLCVAGAMMYATSSNLAAEERADTRARINNARMLSRASFLPETLLPSTSASVKAELRTMAAEAGDLGARADAREGTRADATSDPADAFRATGASCSCACCVGPACELDALTAALGARSGFGGDEADATSPQAARVDETRAGAVLHSFDAGSPAACDAEACRARFTDACPKHASAGIVSARFHAESAPSASGRDAFESFETSVVGAVFSGTETVFEDMHAPPSADDVRRAETWVRDAAIKARAAEAAIESTVDAVAESSGLTPEQIAESAARAEAEQAARDAAEAAATNHTVTAAEAPEEAAAEAPEEAIVEEAAAEAPEEAAAEAPEEAAAEAPEEAAAEAPEEAAAEAPEDAVVEEAAAEAPEEAAADAPEEAAAEAPEVAVVDDSASAEDSADVETSPSPSNVSVAARLGWITDGTSGELRRDTQTPLKAFLGQAATKDAERGAFAVWDAIVAANDAAARGDADALGAIMEGLETTLAVETVNEATGETERTAPQLNGGLPHYVDVDVSDDGGAVEAFIAPFVTAAATLGEDEPAEPDASADLPDPRLSQPDAPEPRTFRREFIPLQAEHDPRTPWRAPVAVVVAHYDEWDALPEMPVWANNSKDPREFPDAPRARGYTVAPMYQRRRPENPGYVPNHGYEGGVYLKFVVDHYDNLPDVTVFMQADADAQDDLASRLGRVVTRQRERGDIEYLPINVGSDFNPEQVYFHKREPYQEWWSETSLRDIDACWRTVAGWWGHEWPEETVPTVSGYCCNYFAASRESIRRTPLETWRKAYEQLIERAECVPGKGPVATRADDKWQIAITLEHLAHVMFGGHFPHYPRHCGEGRAFISSDAETESSDVESSDSPTEETSEEEAFLGGPVMGTFPDGCCGGDACGSRGVFYAEDTDWSADVLDFESGAPPRPEPPDLGEGEDQSAWARLGLTAGARDDALVGLAANHGLSPNPYADPTVRSVEFKRAALALARQDMVALGDDEEAWRAAIEAGVSVKELALALAGATAVLGSDSGGFA